MPTSNRRRPRALTLTLPNAKQPFFVLQGVKYTLRNFSEHGIGLWVPPPVPFGLAAGSEISGDVVIGNELFPVRLEIKHISQTIIGFRFVEVPKSLSQTFKDLMEPSLYGAALNPQQLPIGDDPENGFQRLWYQAHSGSELVVWFNAFSRMISALQICWQGKWAFRRQYEPSEVAFLKDGLRFDGSRRKPEECLPVDEHHRIALLHEAAQFLTASPPPLPGHLFWQFLELGEQVYLPEDFLQKSRVA